MNANTMKTPRRWLNPSAALNRFKPPQGMTTGIVLAERQRARYGFRVGDIGLLVGLNTVSEVLEKASIFPLPNTPPWLLGLVNLRGNLVPVFDVRLFLELKADQGQEKRWLMVLDQGDRAVGLLIDGLPQTASTQQVLSRLPPLPTALRAYASKAYAQEGGVWLEFDHQGFFQALGGRMAGAE